VHMQVTVEERSHSGFRFEIVGSDLDQWFSIISPYILQLLCGLEIHREDNNLVILIDFRYFKHAKELFDTAQLWEPYHIHDARYILPHLTEDTSPPRPRKKRGVPKGGVPKV